MLVLSAASRMQTAPRVEIPQLELLSHLSGDDLPNAPGGVATWPASFGPDAIQDVTLAYGLATYTAAAINGKPGVSCDRNVFPRLMYADPLCPTREDFTMLIVSAPSSAGAIATTRGYHLGWTETAGFGTRGLIAHNGNNGDFAAGGFVTEGSPPEAVGLNHSWHQFRTQAGPQALNIAGPQISVWSLGRVPFWMRNGVVLGYGMSGSWELFRRAPSHKVVLWSDEPGGTPGDTTTFFDGLYCLVMWWLGAANEQQALDFTHLHGAPYGLG